MGHVILGSLYKSGYLNRGVLYFVTPITMEHAKARHLARQERTSYFTYGLDVYWCVQHTLENPAYVTPHPTHAKRTWYFRRFEQAIGQRGYDQSPCHWMAVLMNGYQLVTTFPVPHPNTMACVRKNRQRR